MANQRGDNQTLIGFWAEASFAEKMDSARGAKPRSQFMREAIAEYLQKCGQKVAMSEIFPPDRVGKRNVQKVTRYPSHRPSAESLNDAALNEAATAGDALRGAIQAGKSLGLSPKAVSPIYKNAAPPRPARPAPGARKAPPTPAPK